MEKVLFLYFPDKFIGYYTTEYVSKIAAMLGIKMNADVFQTNHEIAQKVDDKITDSQYSEAEKNIGFTIYLYDNWNDYIRKSVGS